MMMCPSPLRFLLLAVVFSSAYQFRPHIEGQVAMEGQPVRFSGGNNLNFGGLEGALHRLGNNWLLLSSVHEPHFEGDSKTHLWDTTIDFDAGSFIINSKIAFADKSLGGEAFFDPNWESDTAWVVTETFSDLIYAGGYKTFRKSFDPRNYDKDTLQYSNLQQIHLSNGSVISEATGLPRDRLNWDMSYDWDYNACTGDRPFMGFAGGDVATDGSFSVVSSQTALFQDGPTAKKAYGTDARLWVFDENKHLSHSFRYPVTRITETIEVPYEINYNQIFGIIPLLGETDYFEFLVLEATKVARFGEEEWHARCRVFYVKYHISQTVDHCFSLDDCSIDSPDKFLLMEIEHNQVCTDISRGTSEDTFVILIGSGDEIKSDDVIIAKFRFNINEIRRQKLTGELVRFEDDYDYLDEYLSRLSALLVTLIAIMAFGWVSSQYLATHTEGSFPWAFDKRSHGLLTAILNSFFMGGIIFGIAAAKMAFRQQNVFSENCVCGTFCSAQTSYFILLGILGLAGSVASRLMGGILLDSYGPKFVCCLGNILFIVGCICCMFTGEDNEILLLIGWTMIAIGGASTHICGMHFGELFSRKHAKQAVSFCSIAMSSSSLIFPFLQLFVQYHGLSLPACFAILGTISVICLFNNLTVQPPNSFKRGSSQHNIPAYSLQKMLNFSGERKGLMNMCNTKNLAYLKDPYCWGNMLFFTIHFFSYSYYINSLNLHMVAYGDVKLTPDMNNILDNLYTKVGAWFNGLGFIWSFHIKSLVSLQFWVFFAVVACLHILAFICLSIPILEIQVVTFSIESFVRTAIFAGFYTFIQSNYGMGSFGLLVGVGSMIAACFGLLVWPMQEWVVFEMQGNWFMGNIIIISFQFLSLSWPAYLYFTHEKESRLCTPSIMNDYLKQFTKLTKIERVAEYDYDGTYTLDIVEKIFENAGVNWRGSEVKTFFSIHARDKDVARIRDIEAHIQHEVVHEQHPTVESVLEHILDTVYIAHEKGVNWAHTVEVEMDRIVYPEDEKEIQALVKINKRVRCMGAFHSSAPIVACEDGVIISMVKYNKILSLDEENMRVRIEAGVTVRQLMFYLAEKGYAISNSGSVAHQTFVGAASTGTHGGSMKEQCLHALITHWRMIDPDGEIFEVDENHEHFYHMAPTIGRMGVVSVVDVKIVPLYYLRAQLYDVPLDDLHDYYWDDAVQKFDYFRVMCYPHSGVAKIWGANRIEYEELPADYDEHKTFYYKTWDDQVLVREHCQQLIRKAEGLDVTYDEIHEPVKKVFANMKRRLKSYSGRYDYVLTLEHNNQEYHGDMELVFDLKDAKEVLKEMTNIHYRYFSPNYVYELRVSPSNIYPLAANYNRDVLWIDISCIEHELMNEYFKLIQQSFRKFNYRMHWAKGIADNMESAMYIASQYDRWNECIDLFEIYDPDAKFTNVHVRNYMIRSETNHQDTTRTACKLKRTAEFSVHVSVAGSPTKHSMLNTWSE